MNRVGITGAAGFIGSHLTDRLLAEGLEVVGVDDLSRGSLENLGGALDHPKLRFEVFDCTRARELRSAFAGCDAIVHLAAQKIPRYGGGLHTLESNVAGVKAAARVAVALDADLVSPRRRTSTGTQLRRSPKTTTSSSARRRAGAGHTRSRRSSTSISAWRWPRRRA